MCVKAVVSILGAVVVSWSEQGEMEKTRLSDETRTSSRWPIRLFSRHKGHPGCLIVERWLLHFEELN